MEWRVNYFGCTNLVCGVQSNQVPVVASAKLTLKKIIKKEGSVQYHKTKLRNLIIRKHD